MLKRIALLAMVLALSAYAAVIGYLKLNETALVFPREATPAGLPAPSADLALPFRSVRFFTADSVRLHAWVIPAGALIRAARGFCFVTDNPATLPPRCAPNITRIFAISA